MTALLDRTDYSTFPPEPPLTDEWMAIYAQDIVPAKMAHRREQIRAERDADPKGFAERIAEIRARNEAQVRADPRTVRFLAAAVTQIVDGKRNESLRKFASAALSAGHAFLLDDLENIALAAGLPPDEIHTVLKQQAPKYVQNGSHWWTSEAWGDDWTSDEHAVLALDDPEHPRNIQARLAAVAAVADEIPQGRRVRLTCAADIAPKRAKWLWKGRMALGTLAILAGREGAGKSTVAYWIVAQVTKGTLPGEHYGTPAAVIVAATEDSWAHTIIPRLIAAGADLSKVYRVDVADQIGSTELILPSDVRAVAEAIVSKGALLLLLDPMMSRVSKSLDTHKDQETRQALEPLVAMLEETQATGLGIMHFNKRETDDPLNALMASRAFAAVARSVSTVVHDPDDDTRQRRLFGTPKNNLGPDNLPLLSFSLDSFEVPTDEGNAETSRILWHGQQAESISSVMRRSNESRVRTAVKDASGWLREYLEAAGGEADSAVVKGEAIRLGYSDRTIARARLALQVEVAPVPGSFPRRTSWTLPVTL